MSCHSTKKTAKFNTEINDVVENDGELEFGCYYPSDTIKHLVFYFPEEKKFFINGNLSNIDELCLAIQHDIKQNKGIKYYLGIKPVSPKPEEQSKFSQSNPKSNLIIDDLDYINSS